MKDNSKTLLMSTKQKQRAMGGDTKLMLRWAVIELNEFRSATDYIGKRLELLDVIGCVARNVETLAVAKLFQNDELIFLEKFLESLMFPHFLQFWANSQLRRKREPIADQLILEAAVRILVEAGVNLAKPLENRIITTDLSKPLPLTNVK